jgi:membrane carboxypeptidase/penicillin-binding protein
VIHFVAFAFVFRYRISEAQHLGDFLVTLARDYRVGVAPDAEHRLNDWILSPVDIASLAISQEALRAIVTYEDKRFWYHLGIDPLAVVAVLVRARPRGGATTIPMQLARQLIRHPHKPGRWRVAKRKIYEMTLGTYLVCRFGRRWVLARWLTTIPFGHSQVAGITIAAAKYFGKTPAELDAVDGLLLAERATVYTGRYYPDRVTRLARWAVARGILSREEGQLVLQRFDAMRKRHPGANV